ncbi:flagellin [Devosia submarina]|uniref:flagellin n=1 Tax=Devosia submarina TaxID=1173082 RepID=UPI000D346A0E|nr:hypothetical protein [Devosia submarina]
MIVNKSMYPLQTSFGVISKMQDKFATLQMQLGTGEKSSTLAGMGRDLPLSLSVRSRLDKIEGYSANIETVNLRLSFLDKTLTRFDKIEGEARNAAVPGQYGTGGINMATLPGLSKARLDEIVTMLNEDVAGRYLFGGTATDKAPLPDTETLLNGAGGKGGFEQAVAVRQDADGVKGSYTGLVDDDGFVETPGRLNMKLTGNTLSIGEDGIKPHHFGLKISTYSTSSANSSMTFTPSASVAQTKSLDVNFVAQPQVGDSINLGFTLPDETETGVRLTATFEEPVPQGSFKIGGSLEETALNFQNALGSALERTAKTELRAASVFAAANNFFHESGVAQIPTTSEGAAKPDGLAGNANNYVQWYRGGVVPKDANPRMTISAAVDDTARVNYGMQANESGFLRLIRSQAALAVSEYKSESTVRSGFEADRLTAMGKPEGADRDAALAKYEADVIAAHRLETGFFDGMARRQQAELSEAHNTEAGSIEIITMEIGLARGALQSATARHTDYKAQLNNLLSDIETVSKEDVAMEILALQTRLQASFQTTAMVSQLSLVNFL